MLLTCPACGKPGQADAACARCGCDLSALQRVAAAAAAALAKAQTALREADWSAALDWAEDSWRLLHSTEAARLAFLAAGAQGQTARALRWHWAATNPRQEATAL